MFFFFFKQKTAYVMRISDWSSDVCSSDLCSSTCSEVWVSWTARGPCEGTMGRRSAGPFLFFRGKASLQTPRCPSPQPSPRKREREHHSPSEVVGARLARDLASIVQGAPGKSAGRERSKLPYGPLSRASLLQIGRAHV